MYVCMCVCMAHEKKYEPCENFKPQVKRSAYKCALHRAQKRNTDTVKKMKQKVLCIPTRCACVYVCMYAYA